MLRTFGMMIGAWICVLAMSAPTLAACEQDGDCQPGQMCEEGECVCKPACEDKECGPDQCGGLCGNGETATMGCPPATPNCNAMTFVCTADCMPDCMGKECGSDGCDGDCGQCPCDTCDATAVECAGGTCKVPNACDCICIFDCFGGCPPGEQACLQDCVTSATIEGQITYEGLNLCLEEAGYYDCPGEDQPCQDETSDQCTDEYYACFAGEAECMDMYLCIISCPSGAEGQDCVQGCFDIGSQEALVTWGVFIDCLEGNGYYECPAEDAACKATATETCGEEFIACAHGDFECNDLIACLQDCPPGDLLCSTTCRAHGTIPAQSSLQALYDCVDGECGEGSEADCKQYALDDACNDLLLACMGDDCLPQCKDKVCGSDGCGGSCGDCEGDTTCSLGECVEGAVIADGTDQDVVTPPPDTSGNTFNPIIEDDAAEAKSSGGCAQTNSASAGPALLVLLFVLLVALVRKDHFEAQL